MSHACLLSSGERLYTARIIHTGEGAETYEVGELASYIIQGAPPLGYHDFDFFDKKEPPRPDMDVK
jgi:hypothetical protein